MVGDIKVKNRVQEELYVSVLKVDSYRYKNGSPLLVFVHVLD